MRTSVATVCLSGGLVEKLHACASAGFDGVEIMDADLMAAYESPEEIRTLCERLGLSIDMYQPFRDVEGRRRGDRSPTTCGSAGEVPMSWSASAPISILLCSNAGTATIDDDDLAADQLGRLADLAAAARDPHRLRGTGVGAVRRSTTGMRGASCSGRPPQPRRLPRQLPHPHPRTTTPQRSKTIPGEKIFFLQLADAPALDMDVLQWSRHHRLFPGEGDFDLTGFLGHVLRAGYAGPLSLEVFNDTFRQTAVFRTAAHARRSLTWLADRTALAERRDAGRLLDAQHAHGVDFVEISGDDLHDLDQLLDQLGFAFRGRHRSKPVRLWTAGGARIILNEQLRLESPRLTGFGLTVDDAAQASRRAGSLGADPVYRRTYRDEVELRAVASPDGTEVYWNDDDPETGWVSEFEGGTRRRRLHRRHRPHQPELGVAGLR